MLVGAERKLTARFEALAVALPLRAVLLPGRATGHDKGGVEARGKGIRWQHLVPIPAGADARRRSARQLLARLDARAAEHRDAEGRSIAERFEVERGRMLPLPAHAFRPHAVALPSVSRGARS